MKPICTMTCEDCGKFLVAQENYICIFVIDDEASCVSRCPHCDRIVIQSVLYDSIPKFLEFGVKAFRWNTCEKLEKEHFE